MGRTIIQPIGPLYGEAVNGTVFGRPNGSIYIPETNQIKLSVSADPMYIKKDGTVLKLCSSTGGLSNNYSAEIVAKSQDSGSYIQTEVSDISDFTGSVSYMSKTAGLFNQQNIIWFGNVDAFDITNGTSYYVRAVLMASTNVPVAVSDIIEVTGYST